MDLKDLVSYNIVQSEGEENVYFFSSLIWCWSVDLIIDNDLSSSNIALHFNWYTLYMYCVLVCGIPELGLNQFYTIENKYQLHALILAVK